MSEYDLDGWPLFRSLIEQAGATGGRQPKSKRCFVISPIGDAGSEQRRHADAVMNYIIRPALLDTDYYPHRADHAEAPGRISQHMFDSILDDDLLIAVLTFHNPNVFYELAVAQSAARPMILLIEKGHSIPFDVKDDRVIEYSIDTDDVISGESMIRLRRAVHEFERTGHDGVPPFRPSASPLNSRPPDVRLYERSHEISYSVRLEFMRDAHDRVDLLGIANMAFALHPDAVEEARSRKGSPLRVRVLQVSPDNAFLPALLGCRGEQYVQKVRGEIQTAAEAWQRMRDGAEGGVTLEIRRLTSCLPSSAALITDKQAIWTPYMAARTTAESPSIEAMASSPFHRILESEFEHLWNLGEPYETATLADDILASLEATANGTVHTPSPGDEI